MYTSISGEKVVRGLQEILEREEDIVEAERIVNMIDQPDNKDNIFYSKRQYLRPNIWTTDGFSTFTYFGKCVNGQVGYGIGELITATKSAHAIFG
ncbi:unnamed protein product [Protopolystoma xenopodis]|uniref:Uncharacterized protein n=1 Tax=Protopolystoma xenopodis TaxID=117903 RepID=A0A448WID3_9PLAT|nr:unnamed protein product [Protopolystoma xenopodis]